MERPTKILHGTDLMSAMLILKHGFADVEQWQRTRFAEPGWVCGTQVHTWAKQYAIIRVRNYHMRAGAILEIDITGLHVEVDPTRKKTAVIHGNGIVWMQPIMPSVGSREQRRAPMSLRKDLRTAATRPVAWAGLRPSGPAFPGPTRTRFWWR